MPLAAGVRLGPYEVGELLGAGGMAEVYRAHDPRLGRDVAVKIVLTDGEPAPERLRRFEDEARAVAALSHPNVLTVFDVGSCGGRPYIVLELLEGETLRQRLERGAIPLRSAVELAIEVCHGLEAAHAHSVVHCDLKPDNLFLTADGRVKILDFGIARLTRPTGRDPADTDTKPGLLLGTVGYVSPEQARGLVPDGRADVFALGAILYEALSGRRAFGGASAADTIAAVLHDDPPPLRVALGPVPSMLDRVVRRCLHKDPDERFHSAHDLGLALEALLDRPLPGGGPASDEEERSPYPGLRAFTEADAGRFFGREADVSRVWERLRHERLLCVIGPSGAGKTSFVRAGVAAAQPTGWAVIVCTPGTAPLQQLGQCLAPHLAGDPEALRLLVRFDDPESALALLARWRRGYVATVVIVDQFEELFTLNPPECQARFATFLARLAEEADVRVVLSMRDDFLMRCHDHAGLRPVFDGLVPLGAPSGDALRRALVEPARAEGCRFDEGLADEMLAAVEGERGALPLLAFSVARLWSERDRGQRLLSRAAYEQSGGVAGALAQHAEETLERIGDARQALVRDILRNLVTAEGTRASVDREELLSAFEDGRAAEEVLDELVDARLLTTYEARARDGERRYRVEIIHESLLRAWPRLVRWQAQDAEGALLRDQLKQASHLWHEKGRPADLLWSGTSYREFELWRERYPGALTAVEEQFARAMVSRAELRKRRYALGIAGAFAALLLVLAVIGVLLRRTNLALERSVVDEARARASKLVALGRDELSVDSTGALAFARRSLETADTVEGRLLALEALWRGPVVSVLHHGMDCARVTFSSDGGWLACSGFTPQVAVVQSNGADRIFELHPTMADARSTVLKGTPPELLTWLPGDDRVRELSLDGRELRSFPGEVHYLRPLADGGFATCGPREPGARELVFRAWRPGRKAPIAVGRWIPRPGMRFDQPGVRPLDIDPQLRWAAYGWEDGVYLRSLGPPGGNDDLLGRHRGRLREVTFSPRGERLASIDENGEVKVRAVPSGKELRSRQGAPIARFSMLAFDGRGERLTWATGGEGVLVWDLLDPPDAPPVSLRRGDVTYGRQHGFSPDGRWLAGGGLGGVDFWPMEFPYARVLRGHAEGPVQRLVFSPDSRRLVSCARDGARVWPLTPEGGRQRLVEVGGDYMCYDVGVEPSGRAVLVASPFMGIYLAPFDGGVARKIVDLAGRRRALSGVAVHPSKPLAVVGSTYAPPSERLSLLVVDLETGLQRALSQREEPSEDPYAGNIADAAFTPDGTLLTAGDGGVKRWNLEDGKATTLYGGEGRWAALAASRDGRRVAAVVGANSGDYVALVDAEAVLLDTETGAWRAIPVGEPRLTHAVALDAAGERLVVGDVTGMVRVVRVAGGEPHLLPRHAGPVTDVSISPDGRWIASASGTEIRLWPMPDVSRAPFHTLPYAELMARLRALTNLQVVEDPAAPTGYRLEIGPFPGWKDVPTW